MFDELAQNPEDAEDYDLEALERRDGPMRLPSDNDDDAATLVGRPGGSMADDAVVFDIGDDEGDDDEPAKKRRGGSEHEGDAHERQGLMKDD